jgi:rhomboid protease GluP
MDSSEQTFFCVAVTPDYRQLNIWSLVLLSADIPHRIERQQQNWRIYVHLDHAGEAEQQLADYTRENAGWPPVKHTAVTVEKAAARRPPTVLMMGMLVIFYSVTGPWAWHSKWFSQGAISLTAIMRHGEWWRLVTALTLHADAVHLFGNVLIGGVVVHFLCKEIGSGIGWFSVLLAGTLGNLFNLLWRNTEHLSVGFSTAVFGAIGILCGLAVHRLTRPGDFLLPLGAGASLLAFLGTSGKHTDLGAHLWGLVCGLALGCCFPCSAPI